MPSSIRGLRANLTVLEDAVNAAPQLLDTDVNFSTTASLIGGRLVVSGLLAEDRVSILAGGPGAGQIDLSGATVRFGGTAIGTVAGGVGTDLVVTFAAGVTSAAVDALIQRLAYANASEAPTAARSLTLDVVDAAGGHLIGAAGALFSSAGANPLAGINIGGSGKPAVVDLDGDGRLDLVAGSYYGGLAWWKNTGSVTAPAFTAQGAGPFAGITNAYYSAPALADLDGDGDLDLVVTNFTGQLRYFRNAGSATSPTFVEQTGAANPFGAIGPSGPLTFVDLDGDGRLDLVSGSGGGGFAAWRNTGTTTAPAFFGFAVDPFAGVNTGGSSAPVFLDLDGDGDRDLLAGNLAGEILAWRNTGSPTAPAFTALTGADNPFAGVDVGIRSTLAVGDLTGDGRPDLVVANVGGAVSLFRDVTPLPSIAVTVTAQNDLSVTSGSAVSLREGGWASNVVYRATVVDPDGPGPFFAWSLGGADAALFTIGGDGAVRFKASPDYEAPADAGGNNVYDISVIANDGAGSASRAVAITVTDLREISTLTDLTPALGFGESVVNAAPQRIDADVTFTAGSALGGMRLIVGGLLVEDRVSILHVGSGAGQIGFDGTAVSFGGVTIGTAGTTAGSFSVLLNAQATRPAVEALIEHLTYADASETPTLTRALTIDLVDEVGSALGTTTSVAFQREPALEAPIPADLYATPGGGGSAIPPGFAPDFVDLDGDGLAEIVAAKVSVNPGASGGKYGAGGAQVWKNTGTAANPAYTALTGAANPLNAPEWGSLATHAFTDLDGDGLTDLVGITTSTTKYGGASALKAWRNTGSATNPVFTELTGATNPLNGLATQPQAGLAFVDLNGDGLQDFVMSRGTATNDPAAPLLAWLNTGTAAQPVFTALTGAANPLAGITVALEGGGFGFGDVTGDGRADLIVIAPPVPGAGGVGVTQPAPRVWANGPAGFTEVTGDANPITGAGLGPSGGFMPVGKPVFTDLTGDGVRELLLPGISTGLLTALASGQPVNSLDYLDLFALKGTPPRPTVTITVTPEDDAPRGPAIQALAPLAEDGSRLITTAALLAGWADPEGKPLTVASLTAISGKPGTLVDNGNGSWLFTPAADDDTGVAFQFIASDGLITANGVATLDLLPVNDAPVGGVALSASAMQLTAQAALTDADGMGVVTLHWQALLGGVWTDITGATGPNLVPGAAQAGLSLRAVARYTDRGGTAEQVASDGIALIGTDAGDRLAGAAGPGVLFGDGGNDRLTGGTGRETLAGDTGKDSIEGGGGDDLLDGGAKADTLSGGIGMDTLIGGADPDLLSGGDGADSFRILSRKEGADRITDFAPGIDRIEVLGSEFGGLAPRAAVPFVVGAPVGRGGQFVYDSATGGLSYDPDGTGAKTAVLLATLTGAPALAASDLVVIA